MIFEPTAPNLNPFIKLYPYNKFFSGLQTKRLQNKRAMKNSSFFMAFLLFERKYNAERKDKALQEKNRGLANVF